MEEMTGENTTEDNYASGNRPEITLQEILGEDAIAGPSGHSAPSG